MRSAGANTLGFLLLAALYGFVLYALITPAASTIAAPLNTLLQGLR